MDKKPKVVFTFVEAGLGHIIPMTGMCEEFTKKYGDKCEIVKSYFFRDSKYKEVNELGLTLSNHTKKTMSNIVYNKLEAISYMFSSKLTLWFLDMVFGKKKKYCYDDLKNLNPDLIVSSYYLPSHLAYKTNKKGITDTLIATYTPDTYIYPAWDRNCDMYIVNNDRARKQALKKGFKENQVKQVPFIYKEEILNTSFDKEQLKKKFDIDNGKFTVLMSCGAYGSKNTEKIAKQILNSDLDINFIMICGKSEKLFETMQQATKKDKINFKLIGFTSQMAEYIQVSDLIIGKSGMNAIMEAVYIGCPIITTADANRLEENITKNACRDGLIVKIHNGKKVIKFIQKCIDNPTVLNSLKENFAKYHDDTGAEKAADMLFDLLATKYPQLKEN